MSHYIHFDSVSKSYGSLNVINRLDLNIAQGEFVSLLGPSGSGKTTLLMMLAGFEQPTGGQILVNGERIDQLPTHKRNMGVVFQNYALFPHLSIAENIAFPLRCRHFPAHEIKKKMMHALDMVRLSQLADRLPSQLSGGQQQRIALARALVFEPKVVLMDEPLGALDKQLREHMQLELRQLHQSLGLTVVFVTHDQTEAITMSDRIAVFNAGKIEQVDSPQRIYFRPRTRFVANFIGETNLLPATVDTLSGDTALIRLHGGQSLRISEASDIVDGQEILVSVRPEFLHVNQKTDAGITLEAQVTDVVFQGDHTRLHLDYCGTRLVARLPAESTALTTGQTIQVTFCSNDCALVRNT